jgi:hypothetical protein
MNLFYETLNLAIDDLRQHGYDDPVRLANWAARLHDAWGRSVLPETELIKSLARVYQGDYEHLVTNQGLLTRHPGVDRFTLQQIEPRLRAELDRRIHAAANLIKLNRDQAIEQTLRRFSGWATSIPLGGSTIEPKRAIQQQLRKGFADLPFLERRVAIDQGHKLISGINEIVATDGGAIAARWDSRWRRQGYNYRPDHKERDGKIYLLRDSWARQAGYVKPLPENGYVDDHERPGEWVYCSCTYVYLYHLRDLPPTMLTRKGQDALAAARTKISPPGALYQAISTKR